MVFVVCAVAIFLVFGILWIWRFDSRWALIASPVMLLFFWELANVWSAAIFNEFQSDRVARDAVFVFAVGTAALLAGVFVSMSWLRWKPDTLRKFRDTPIEIASLHGTWIAGAAALLAIIAASLYLHQGVPAFVLGVLGGPNQDLAQLIDQTRFSITKQHYFSGGEYRGEGVFVVLIRVLAVFASTIFFCLYLNCRTLLRLGMFLVAAFICLLAIASEGARAGTAFFVVQLYVLASLTLLVRARHLIGGVFFVAALTVFISVFSGKLYSSFATSGGTLQFYTDSLLAMVERMFVPNGLNSMRLIELANQGEFDFQYGMNQIQTALNMLPGVNIGRPLSHSLYLQLHPGHHDTFFWSMTYAGELYIDFGAIGILIVYLLIGVTMPLAQYNLLKLAKTPVNLAVTASFFYYLGMSTIIGVLKVIPFLIITIVVAFGLRAIEYVTAGQWLTTRAGRIAVSR